MTSGVDSALAHLGSPGWYHIAVYICLGFNNMIVVQNHLAMVVFAPKTLYRCPVPDMALNDTAGENELTPGECLQNQTSSFDGNWTSTQLNCPCDWEYKTTGDEHNLIMQFGLVGERTYLIHLATSIYFCGVMLGGLVFGTLSDMFGRRPFLLLTLYAPIGIGIWTAFTNKFVIFIFLRFVQGFLMQGLQTTSLVLIMELFPRHYTTVVGSVFEVFWALGVMWLALLAYLLQDWQHVQLAIAVPSVLTAFYVWLIPESLRWLVANNKLSEAERVLQKAARFNRVALPAHLLKPAPSDVKADSGLLEDSGSSSSDQDAPRPPRHNLTDMVRTAQLRKRSLIQFYIWFVVTATYYGISLRLSSFAGNKYLNFFYGGLCELPAYCAAYFIVNRFGRKVPLVIYLFLGGLMGIVAGVTSQLLGSDAHLAWVSTTMAVLSRVSMAGCFSIIWLYTSELYPTVIRNVSVGACTFWMRIGAMVAPQILHLGDQTYSFLPIIIFGSLCIVGGVITLLLPETKGCSLPETICDVEVTNNVTNNVSNRGSKISLASVKQVNGSPQGNGYVKADENGDLTV